MSLEEPFEGVHMKLNDLPESLFVNVGFEDGIFGPGADGVYVCPDHNGRRLPCRTCLYREPAKTPYMNLHDYRMGLVFEALDQTGYDFHQPIDTDAVARYLAEKGF